MVEAARTLALVSPAHERPAGTFRPKPGRRCAATTTGTVFDVGRRQARKPLFS